MRHLIQISAQCRLIISIIFTHIWRSRKVKDIEIRQTYVKISSSILVSEICISTYKMVVVNIK